MATITGTVEHEDDALRGPLKITFVASKGTAKFNTIEIKRRHGSFRGVIQRLGTGGRLFRRRRARAGYQGAADLARSVAPIKERADDLIRRMSLAEKVAQLQNGAPGIPRLGLPAYNYWNEALHGVANNGIATVFPEPVGGAASWNPALFHQEGTIIGIEGRAKFNDYANSAQRRLQMVVRPDFLDAERQHFPRPALGPWPGNLRRRSVSHGRPSACSSSRAFRATIRITCSRWPAPNITRFTAARNRCAISFDAVVSDRDLYETYLPQFERVVREGKVAGVMGSYNAVDGVPACANSFLLTELLRKQWGFEGYIVSDCDAIGDIWRSHHYAKTPEEAAAAAIKAGCDLCCGSDYNALVRAVQQGLVTEKEIDQALYYTLWTRFKLGLFDPADMVPYSKYTLKDNDTPEHAAGRPRTRAPVFGAAEKRRHPAARPLQVQTHRGHRAEWQINVHVEGNYHGSASHPVSILDGIKQLAGPNIEVTFALGSPITTKQARPRRGAPKTTRRPVHWPNSTAEALAPGDECGPDHLRRRPDCRRRKAKDLIAPRLNCPKCRKTL